MSSASSYSLRSPPLVLLTRGICYIASVYTHQDGTKNKGSTGAITLSLSISEAMRAMWVRVRVRARVRVMVRVKIRVRELELVLWLWLGSGLVSLLGEADTARTAPTNDKWSVRGS